MARIRSIKPGVFKHEDLFEAEVETGLPLRLCFIGLWPQCDREGRFLWRPRTLKTDILPYDDIDFSRVLDALATRGFVRKYTANGVAYGCIPSWHRHQVINNREAASEYPQPPDGPIEPDASPTRAPRDTDLHVHAQGEGKGREGERKGEEKGGAAAPTELAFAGRVIRLLPLDFERWRKSYPNIADLSAELTKADDYYFDNPTKDGKWFFHVSRWLAKANAEAKRADPDEDIYRGVL